VRRLLIRPGAIGDCILSLPAMEALRASYTEVWVAEANAPLIRFADRVRSIGSTGLNLVGIEGLEPPRIIFEELAKFDSIVSWYGANRPEFRAALAGFPIYFFPALPPADCRTHACDFFLEHARQVGASVEAAVPRLECRAERRHFAVIHPFSGNPAKNWPLAEFLRLAGWLSERMPVVWCAGPEEPLEEAVRFDNLWDLACWLASSRLYIGNDSGITHLAAATGTSVVAIFGPTDPALWGPRGRNVRIVAPEGPFRLSSPVSLHRVQQAVESML